MSKSAPEGYGTCRQLLRLATAMIMDGVTPNSADSLDRLSLDRLARMAFTSSTLSFDVLRIIGWNCLQCRGRFCRAHSQVELPTVGASGSRKPASHKSGRCALKAQQALRGPTCTLPGVQAPALPHT